MARRAYRATHEQAPTFSTVSFTYDVKSRSFVTEMSVLNCGGERQVFGFIYGGLTDKGFNFMSHKTGAVKEMVLHTIQEDDEDILAWVLVPADEVGVATPSFTVNILND